MARARDLRARALPLFALFSCSLRPATALRSPLPLHSGHMKSHRACVPLAMADGEPTIARQPSGAVDVLQLGAELLQLEPTPLVLAQLTDAIVQSEEVEQASPFSFTGLADSLRRARRTVLLADMLRKDRSMYLETVKFLSIPRQELPNLQDVPIRPCDSPSTGTETVTQVSVEASDELVPDCTLPEKKMGENLAEAALLRITRNFYAEQTLRERDATPGIRGLLEEMRGYMLSPEGVEAKAQQQAVYNTLKLLMTPVLPPFYRIFMGGIVPSVERGDPRWLVDGVQSAVKVVDRLPFDAKSTFQPGRQLGPLPYAPLLTAVVAPFAFGFLVGPSKVNLRSDGNVGGLVVEKCKFLQESNCKGMCLNSCKLPAQQLFDELGVPLRVSPNFETQECQWSFGEIAPPPQDDPTWPKGCVVGCGSREAMKELQVKYKVAPCV